MRLHCEPSVNRHAPINLSEQEGHIVYARGHFQKERPLCVQARGYYDIIAVECTCTSGAIVRNMHRRRARVTNRRSRATFFFSFAIFAFPGHQQR